MTSKCTECGYDTTIDGAHVCVPDSPKARSIIDPAREATLARLRGAAADGDTEIAHAAADQALCDLLAALGYADVVEAWEKVGKWYA